MALRGRYARRWPLIIAAAIVVAAGGMVVWLMIGLRQSSTSASTLADRSYTTLVDAAWRQDRGVGNTLITATLYTPEIIAALNGISDKTDTQRQIAAALQGISSSKSVVFLLALDSLNGSVADETIAASATVNIHGGPTAAKPSWRPLILTSRVVNTNGNVSSQNGLLVFPVDRDLVWSKITSLTLTVSGIGDQSLRQFSWSNPSLLSAIR